MHLKSLLGVRVTVLIKIKAGEIHAVAIIVLKDLCGANKHVVIKVNQHTLW